MTVDITKISRDQITSACQVNDLDEALRMVMDVIGVTTGDLAAQWNSGDDFDEIWPEADQSKRFSILVSYLKFENHFLVNPENYEDENEPEMMVDLYDGGESIYMSSFLQKNDGLTADDILNVMLLKVGEDVHIEATHMGMGKVKRVK